MARAMLFKTDSMDLTFIDVKSWQEISPLLEANFFDVTTALIGGQEFTLYVDDESLLKDNPIPMAFDSGDLQPMLAGNILVMQNDAAGDSRDLTEEEVENLYMHSMNLFEYHGDNLEGRTVLMLDPRPLVRLCEYCEYYMEDVMHAHFCALFDNHPTVYPTTECLIGFPPEEEGDVK